MSFLSRELLAASLDRRPIVIAIAGSNGAGKSTFFRSFLEDAGLAFVNADILAVTVGLEAYTAAALADSIRRDLLTRQQSFIFETVFSDPEGDKLAFLKQASGLGYSVVLFFIGASGPEISEERVALRVTQGGHDVPKEKLLQRFPRTIENLKAAIPALPQVFILDNSDLRTPFRWIAHYEDGVARFIEEPVPAWLKSVVSKK